MKSSVFIGSLLVTDLCEFYLFIHFDESSNLLHQEVDVQLCVIQNEAMWSSDPLQSSVHRLAVDVDPVWSSRSQEVSGRHRKSSRGLMMLAESRYLSRLPHSLVNLFHFLHDLGTFSVSDILACLPEIEVLRWEQGGADTRRKKEKNERLLWHEGPSEKYSWMPSILFLSLVISFLPFEHLVTPFILFTACHCNWETPLGKEFRFEDW